MIYKITVLFPKEERFAMVSQLRRAAYSIESQIAEGSCMQTSPHQKSFYDRAYGSCVEIDNFLELAHDLDYLKSEQYQQLLKKVNKLAFLIQRLSESCVNA